MIVWKHYIIMISSSRDDQQIITADVNTYPKAWIPVSTTKRHALKISDEYLPNLKYVQKYVPENIHKMRKGSLQYDRPGDEHFLNLSKH